jgi:hypothetical protein
VSWDLNNEKLLSHILIDDRYARLLSERAGEAFFRCFIVEDRATGAVSMKYRFKYSDGNRNWFVVKSRERGAAAVDRLKLGMRKVISTAAQARGTPLPPDAIVYFDPPDDEGDGTKTIQWLVDRDLIEVVGVERERREL